MPPHVLVLAKSSHLPRDGAAGRAPSATLGSRNVHFVRLRRDGQEASGGPFEHFAPSAGGARSLYRIRHGRREGSTTPTWDARSDGATSLPSCGTARIVFCGLPPTYLKEAARGERA